MQNILLQENRLLILVPMVFLLTTLAIGCSQDNADIPKGYEEDITLERDVTPEDLDKLRTETIEEMCKSDSEYRDPDESEEQCVEAYNAVAYSCIEKLEGTVPDVSTVNFVTYALRFANCLRETR